MTAKDLQIAPNGRPPKNFAESLAAQLIDAAISRIVPDKDQPRKTFDQAKIRALAENISQHSLLHPIHVRPANDDLLTLIAGAYRLEAFKLLSRTHIPAFLHTEPLDPQKLRLLQLAENLLRTDVDPIEQALGFQQCLQDGSTASQLARELGVSVSTITNGLDLLTELPSEIQRAVSQGLLGGTIARALTRAPEEDKLPIFRRYLNKELTSRSQVMSAVAAAKKNGNQHHDGPTGFACDIAGVKLRLDLPPGQGVPEAEAAVRELLADLKSHHRSTVQAFCDFLAAKADAIRKASQLKAAEEKVASHARKASELKAAQEKAASPDQAKEIADD